MEGAPSALTISLNGSSVKSPVVTTQTEDNTINILDVLIFRNTDPASPDYHKLDTYKHFSSSELDEITVSTTTGPKIICVVANDHSNTFEGVTDLASFRALTTSLKGEQLSSFTMYGEAEETLDITSKVEISLERHISRIGVSPIKTKFSGTPYAGHTISNVKLYLINVHGEKILYSNASSAEPPVIFNHGALSGNDANSTIEPNLIYEPLTGTIGDTGYTGPHFFYCYSNETSDLGSCTKLVLQCDLAGVTYYYPIPINQPGYGYTDTRGHIGVRRNTSYSYGITVTRPGSLDPDEPILPGSIEITIGVRDWDIIPHFNKEF